MWVDGLVLLKSVNNHLVRVIGGHLGSHLPKILSLIWVEESDLKI